MDRTAINRINPALDRRRKRTPELDQQVREAAPGQAIRALARAFGLAPKTIKVILDPSLVAQYKRPSGSWANYYDKAKHAKATQKTRHYKRKILNGEIK
jgi:hypothetical protein